MIPNCTLDDKQPIEKLFRKGSDNTCIHSLVEWKLDSHCIKDGYRYMTTGFCARKARSAEERELTEEREALDTSGTGEVSGANVSSSDNTSIEYFNYCIFYRQTGPNDIKNLPLVHNGERVTFNGLKAYLRDVTKEDKGIEVHIFDRKGDYQSFISRYGIYESAWEIVRGINKTEGHVRTYFETNYRTSRKVVEDLLIEEIIQKNIVIRIFPQPFFKKCPAFSGIAFPEFIGLPAYFIYILPYFLQVKIKEFINGDIEITCQNGNQSDIREGNIVFPFADGLEGYADAVR